MKSQTIFAYLFVTVVALTTAALICELLGTPGLEAPLGVIIALVFRDDMVYIGSVINPVKELP